MKSCYRDFDKHHRGFVTESQVLFEVLCMICVQNMYITCSGLQLECLVELSLVKVVKVLAKCQEVGKGGMSVFTYNGHTKI